MTSPVAGLPKFSDTSPNTPWLHFDALNAKLDPQLVPHFDTTTDRNNAYAAMVTGGGTMKAGVICTVAGVPYRSTGTSTSAWERLGAVRGGLISGTTSSGGDILISHGLGVTPTSVSLTMGGVANDGIFAKAAAGSLSSTVISARVFDTRTGGVWASAPVNIYWMAMAL